MARKNANQAAAVSAAATAATASNTNAPAPNTPDTAPAESGGKNDGRLVEGVKFIRELGRDAALGKDSLPKLAFQLTKMAAEGVIDLEKKYDNTDKSKGKYDDAEFLFTEYATAEGKKAIHERSGGGAKANISKARQFIAFGVMTTCDPQDVLERAAAQRKEMLGNSEKVKSAYAAYVDVAREQQKHDTDMTNDELKAVIVKPGKTAPELQKILKGIAGRLEALCTDGIGGIMDKSELVEQAFHAVRDRLAEIDAENNPDQRTPEEQTAEAETAAEGAVAQLGSINGSALEALLAKMGYQKAA